ncbi:MAG: helix-turn-helix domain-containing protein [Bacteroidales bacterium]|nr:helix-turn-helix domain-containing protein [Bacteroidales bacterium]
MIRFLYILIVIALWPVGAMAEGEMDYGAFYRDYDRMSVEDLFDRAQETLRANHLDSALAFNTLIQLSDPSKLDAVGKRRFVKSANNLGYIYGSCLNERNQAFQYIDRAISLCQQWGMDYLLAPQYLNKANLYNASSEREEKTKLMRDALDVSLRLDDSERGLRALYETLYLNMAYGDTAELAQTVALAADLPKAWGNMSPYVAEMAQSAQQSLEGHHDIAAQHIAKALSLINTKSAPAYVAAKTRILLAKEQAMAGRTGEAISTLTAVMADPVVTQDTDLMLEVLHALQIDSQSKPLSEKIYWQAKLKTDSIILAQKGSFGNSYSWGMLENEMETVKRDRDTKRLFLSILIPLLALVLVLAALLLIQNRSLRFRIKMLYNLNVDHQQTTTAQKPAEDSIVGKAETFMERNEEIYGADFTLDSLADRLGVKSKALSQALSDSQFKSFPSMLAKFRVSRACQLLNENDANHLTIEGVGEKVGYKSRSHFAMVFKKITGLSPSEYLRMHNQAANANA